MLAIPAADKFKKLNTYKRICEFSFFRGSHQRPQTCQGGHGDVYDGKISVRTVVAYRASVMDPAVSQSFLAPRLYEFLLLWMPAHGILDAFLFIHQEFGFEVFYMNIFVCV